ncbi:NAD+ synthetase [Streptococcus sanguinis SK115]|uniref:NAD+ synthetase n=1 Tax=Streptococcus sanguinis SK115 TaxID=888810 RepID=F0I6G8_STRSA|nr:NAD+ synthetase [Streptococcus sanguinis SK115]
MCKLYEWILNGGIILNFEFGTVDKFMNDFIQNKYKQKSNNY